MPHSQHQNLDIRQLQMHSMRQLVSAFFETQKATIRSEVYQHVDGLLGNILGTMESKLTEWFSREEVLAKILAPVPQDARGFVEPSPGEIEVEDEEVFEISQPPAVQKRTTMSPSDLLEVVIKEEHQAGVAAAGPSGSNSPLHYEEQEEEVDSDLDGDCDCFECVENFMKFEDTTEEETGLNFEHQDQDQQRFAEQEQPQPEIPPTYHQESTTPAPRVPKKRGRKRKIPTTVPDDLDNQHRGLLFTDAVECWIPNCARTLTSVAKLDQHLKTVHQILPFRCAACPRSFWTRDDLLGHIQHQHGTHTWRCSSCSARCRNYASLSQHIRWNHHVGHFRCSFPGCTFASTIRGQVYEHYKAQHHSSRSRSTLASNSRSSTNAHSTTRQYQCPFEGCDKSFTGISNLRTHERIHLGLKLYRCRWPRCDFGAEHSSDVIKHIRTKHFGIPRTQREQRERNIVDHRDPKIWMERVVTNMNG